MNQVNSYATVETCLLFYQLTEKLTIVNFCLLLCSYKNSTYSLGEKKRIQYSIDLNCCTIDIVTCVQTSGSLSFQGQD